MIHGDASGEELLIISAGEGGFSLEYIYLHTGHGWAGNGRHRDQWHYGVFVMVRGALLQRVQNIFGESYTRRPSTGLGPRGGFHEYQTYIICYSTHSYESSMQCDPFFASNTSPYPRRKAAACKTKLNKFCALTLRTLLYCPPCRAEPRLGDQFLYVQNAEAGSPRRGRTKAVSSISLYHGWDITNRITNITLKSRTVMQERYHAANMQDI